MTSLGGFFARLFGGWGPFADPEWVINDENRGSSWRRLEAVSYNDRNGLRQDRRPRLGSQAFVEGKALAGAGPGPYG
jgi:hypothetical protein